MRGRLAAGITAGIAAACLGIGPAAATAAPTTKASASTGVRELPPGKTFSTARLKSASPTAKRQARALAATPGETPPVGTVRPWLALDDELGQLYLKDYTLRAVGEHIEVWVANDLSFPAGDCRAQIPNSTTITDAQAQRLVTEFDTNMYPKETATFSTPESHDGSHPDPVLDGFDFTGEGDNTVALIDNVRDDNYYTFPAAPTYIAGFFSSQFNQLVDRNVMTIDAFDWAHRTTDNPPDEPTNDL